MSKIGEAIDSGFEFAYDLASSHSIPQFIGEKLTDATLKLLREPLKEEHEQTATTS